ncbi:probable inactive receptor kinase At5g67200 [Coffea eugenioides]|uniref:probable inactive receptor kinase At5g67200 n=1 Tax=Coffea eugenioides TaxID=49369 RepID=UPI000F6117FA|nr:probable inactive receptor kinase At5g67200 [Coffea eugenioides]
MRAHLLLRDNVISLLIFCSSFLATLVHSSRYSIDVLPLSDASALLAFESKAGLRSKLGFSPETSSSFCKWAGVQCSQTRVVRFVVEGMDLGGVFAPSTLTRLDQLRVLSLQNNSLAGPIPDLSGLVNLKVLFLSHNSFTGSIPPSLSTLHRLKTLDLSHNNLTGPVPISFNNLDRLYTLRLDSNRFNGSIPALNQSTLQMFNISSNNLTGPIPITPTLLRFKASLFSWNPGLCGEIIHKECREMQHFFGPVASPPPPKSVSADQSSQIERGKVGVSSQPSRKAHGKAALIIGLSGSGLFFICSFICFAFATRTVKKKKKESSAGKVVVGEATANANAEALMRIEEDNYELEEKVRRVQEGVQIAGMGKSGNLVFCAGEAQVYTLEQLMRASAELLGKGTMGTTYKAVLDSRLIVCVKRLDGSRLAGTSQEVFEGHMESVGSLRHPNLVPLRAYFQAKEERLLVYDYQPNGSLFSLIHGSKSARAKPLHWTSCLKIAEDVAQGLSYIHQAWRLVHGNLKSSNVLLGSDFEACLTDYCLSALATTIAATAASSDEEHPDFKAYKAPEALKFNNDQTQANTTTSKSDVYSFGVLLLELLSGKHPSQLPILMPGDMMNWVKLSRDEENRGEDNKLEMLLEVSIACSVASPEQRPTMWQVLKMIQEIKEAVIMEEN